MFGISDSWKLLLKKVGIMLKLVFYNVCFMLVEFVIVVMRFGGGGVWFVRYVFMVGV